MLVKIINNIRNKIVKQFELKELGIVKHFLGFDIIRDYTYKKIFVLQKSFIHILLAKKNILDYNLV